MDQQNEQATPEIQHPDLPMKWHKFLIYFLMWLWVVVDIYNANDAYTYLGGKYSFIPYESKELLWAFFIGEGLMAIYTIKVRFDLARFRKNGPKGLSYVYLGTALLVVLYMFFVNANHGDPSQYYGQIAINVIMFFASRKYYLARDFLFVN